MWTTLLIVASFSILLKLVSSASFVQSDRWDQYPTIPNFYKPHLQCLPIPPNMTLCQNIGYNKMVLPNFLDHTSAVEAIHQSNIWNSLAQTKCHPGLQQFLCSLYAPVCLKGIQQKKIPPCFQLCDQVRRACEPRMHQYGYKWPDIVKCEQFRDDHLCIRLSQPSETVSATPPTSSECAPCRKSASYDDVIRLFCIAKFAARAKIQKATRVQGGFELTLASKTKMFKSSAVKINIASYFLPCNDCSYLQQQSEELQNNKFLIMGSVSVDGRATIDFLMPIKKSQTTNLKRAFRAFRKTSEIELCRSINEGQPATSPAPPPMMNTTPMVWNRYARPGGGGGGGSVLSSKKQKKSVADDRDRREINRCRKFLKKIADRRKRRRLRRKQRENSRTNNGQQGGTRRQKNGGGNKKRNRNKQGRKQRRQKRKEKMKKCKKLLKTYNIAF